MLVNPIKEEISREVNTQDALSITSQKVNILLVDDKWENLLSLESILEDSSRNILKAMSGNDALKLAFENEIAIVLLDVQMPEMDGFEVAKLLKENPKTKDIAIIFVTAISKEERFALQGYEDGAVDYLHKPLDINIVKAKVRVFERLYRQREELNEYVGKVEAINRQLNEFVYIVSHDLKAPLRGLTSLTAFLGDELKGNTSVEVTELLNLIRSRTDRMQKLIDAILHYSRMANNKAEKEPVDLKELINEIIDLLDIPSNIKIEYPDNMPVLTAERIKLHEIFQNLILNGIKYNNKESGHIKISHQETPMHHQFSVQDNGVGIKKEHFEKIFGIFQTLQPKDRQESTGIGLTIVKKIVEQLGGEVWIESEYGTGATFSFTISK